jgi:hypothetical protein
LELRALTTILRSVGPVISTRRSTRPGAGGAPFHVGFSRMWRVSGRKSGRTPRSSSAWRSLRRSRRFLRVELKERWRRARKARACGVRILRCDSCTGPRTATPWRMLSVEAMVVVVVVVVVGIMAVR